LIHDIQTKLDHAGIYEQHHVENAARVFLEGDGKKGHNKLSAALAEPTDRFWKKLDEARAANDSQEVDRLYDFRKTVDGFVKTYGFLSQLYNYDDTDVEKHFLFFKFFSRLIRDTGSAPTIDLSEVELVAYAIRKDSDGALDLDDGKALGPLTAVGGGVPRDPEMVALAEIVDKLNSMFDIDGVTEADTRNIVIWVMDKAMENEIVKTQAAKNTRDQFLESNQLKESVLEALVNARTNAEALSAEFLESKEKIDQLTQAVGELIHRKLSE